MVTSSLKNARPKEPALAKKATSDLEFAKYFTNNDFMNIIKIIRVRLKNVPA